MNVKRKDNEHATTEHIDLYPILIDKNSTKLNVTTTTTICGHCKDKITN